MGRRRNRVSKSEQGQKKGTSEGKEAAALSFPKDNDGLTGREDKHDNVFEELRQSEELLFEVFSRLVPRVLFKFKCVSKGFCNLIGQPDFAAHHGRTCKAFAGKALTGLFFIDKRAAYYVYIQFTPLEPGAGDLPDPKLQFLNWKGGQADEIDVIDSCNGLLLCISKKWGKSLNKFFVCNPLTREKIELPHHNKPFRRVSFALMADVDCNYLKYRVLCLVRAKYFGGDAYSQLFMLSSETGEWVELCDKLPPVSYGFENGSKVFFNGSLYWDCIEGHILVCHLLNEEPCYKLIKAPRAIIGRCLWKSKEKLECHCHGVREGFEEYWTLDREGIKWTKTEDCDKLRNLSDDFASSGLTVTKKIASTEFNIVSYAPESETFFLRISNEVYRYKWKDRTLEFFGGFGLGCFREWPSESQYQPLRYVLPYTHTLMPIHTAKSEAERGVKLAKQTAGCDDDDQMNKVRGRRNKRTPRCHDFSTED